jgi:hypothetical protein
MTFPRFWKDGQFSLPRMPKGDGIDPVPFIGLLLIVLALLMLIEAIRVLISLGGSPPQSRLEPVATMKPAAAPTPAAS